MSSVSSFLAFAPCVFKDIDEGNTPVEFSKGVGRYRYLGIYAVNGPNWDNDLNKICTLLDSEACKEAKRLA